MTIADRVKEVRARARAAVEYRQRNLAHGVHVDRLRRKGGRRAASPPSSARRSDTSATGPGRRLADITRTDCRALHERLTESSGPCSPAGSCRYVRAVYNTALKEHDLPVNPTIAVHWNKEERRRGADPWANLPAWRAAIDALSAVRRDYQLVVLLTGLRRVDAATIGRAGYGGAPSWSARSPGEAAALS